MDPVVLEKWGGVAEVTLNRPERLNALDGPCRVAMLEALQGVASDETIRAVILTGAGRAFCTGQDVAASEELVDAGATVRDTYNPLVRSIRGMPKPVIVAVNGPAVGAGLGLALACDLRLMAESAYLSCSFSRVGLVPDTGVSVGLVRLLGHALAYEIAVSARRVPAAEALELVMVNRVMPDEELRTAARDLAERLARGPTLAFAMTKQAFMPRRKAPRTKCSNSRPIIRASRPHRKITGKAWRPFSRSAYPSFGEVEARCDSVLRFRVPPDQESKVGKMPTEELREVRADHSRSWQPTLGTSTK